MNLNDINFEKLQGNFLVASPYIQDPKFAKSVVWVCETKSSGCFGLIINQKIDDKGFTEIFDYPGLDDCEVYLGGPMDPDKGFLIHTNNYIWSETLKITERIAITSMTNILSDSEDSDTNDDSDNEDSYASEDSDDSDNEDSYASEDNDEDSDTNDDSDNEDSYASEDSENNLEKKNQKILKKILDSKNKLPNNMICILGYIAWSAGKLEQEIQQNLWIPMIADANKFIFEIETSKIWAESFKNLNFKIDQMAPYIGNA